MRTCGKKAVMSINRLPADAVSQLALRRDGDKGLVCNSVRRGSNNFKQHLLPQLCGCLIQALDIYTLFCNKESFYNEMKRIIENSVFLQNRKQFLLISLSHGEKKQLWHTLCVNRVALVSQFESFSHCGIMLGQIVIICE